MDPVEEFARLKDAIRALEDRAQALRASFLKPGARLRSNRSTTVATFNRCWPNTASIVTATTKELAKERCDSTFARRL